MYAWATPLVAFFGAIITAWVATRNARKTPHENLKTLTDIRTALADELPVVDPEEALSRAISLEVKKLDEVTAARERGLWAYFWAVAGQRRNVIVAVWALATGFIALAVFATGSSLVANEGCYPSAPHVNANAWWVATAIFGGLFLLGTPLLLVCLSSLEKVMEERRRRVLAAEFIAAEKQS
jgi:hypothetical protein